MTSTTLEMDESQKIFEPLDQVYDSLDEKICDGKNMSKNMYWSTYMDFKTGKKVDIEADIHSIHTATISSKVKRC